MPPFKFKRFSVVQDNCAMRINTDGLLLATLLPAGEYGRILDVGTGTGALALVMAQRFNDAAIYAAELDSAAAETAKKNFMGSAWSERLHIYKGDYAGFMPHEKLDLILSNPPWFINDLKNRDSKKTMARHADKGFFTGLMAYAARWLADEGRLALITPYGMREMLISWAAAEGLHAQQEIAISSYMNSEPIRIIMIFKRGMGRISYDKFVIYDAERKHSAEYNNALKDYLLAL